MTTIYDIARTAGVSHTTVSRVINASGYVKDETRERVLKAVADLGYYPNELARGLVNRRTTTVALIVSDITSPFFTTVARGAEDVASHNGYSIVLCNTDESVDKENAYIDLVLRKQFDGVLLASAARSGAHLQRLVSADVPLVLLDRKVRGVKADVVRADGHAGARVACEHLVGRGHRRIALLSGPLHLGVMTERLGGYREALAGASLGADSSLILAGEPRFDVGVMLARQVLEMESPPSAVLCTNSLIGLGAYAAVREAGIAIPARMALVVFDFDAVDMYSRAFPFVTSVSQPAYDLGRYGMEFLLERMSGHWDPPGTPGPRDMVLPTRLIERTSS